ncbi:hflK [Symbiodinium microadriaticum]|nr:hflK [Symbiodinium microadriaticum]
MMAPGAPQGQDRFRSFIPGQGGPNSRTIILGLLVLIAIWFATGFYRVNTDEQGVVLRFGKYVGTTNPGLNYHLPSPIETVLTPKVTRVNEVEVGFRSSGPAGRGSLQRDVAEESLMLTGDENIVDIDFKVQWVIGDAGKYLFNVEDPEATVKAVAESAMREVVGQRAINPILNEARAEVEQSTRVLMQGMLDSYEIGIIVNQVQLQKADPPAQVIDAFRDVQAARADAAATINQAQAYARDVVPRARGEAQKIIEDANAYKAEVVAQAEGEAQRFLSVYGQYKEAKDVTRRRIFLETMEQDVEYIDRRNLGFVSNDQEVIAADEKRLVVDAFARWRIIDALKYFQTVRTQAAAETRLETFLDASMRQVLGQQTLLEILSDKRADFMGVIAEGVDEKARDLGIEIIDVRIRRADLPEANSNAVYRRMQTERQRDAKEERAKGFEIATQTQAEADKEVRVIKAEANRQSEILRGEGEAESNRIFAEAFSKDPDFFAFYRSMLAYSRALKSGETTMVLSPDSEFFEYFGDVKGK